ncbi:MAG: lipopolysaccharide biosynthesis protein [Anaerolineae bacterium]|nr:lipopolysaccharide biosynthesis protein [Anaerolineae bacterium]
MPKSVLSKSAEGSIYNIAASGLTIVFGFVRSVILMRLLGPEEFGIVTLALFFTVFVAPVSSLGIDLALIQRQNPPAEAFSTHFILRLGLSSIVLLVGILLSPLLRWIYADQVMVVNIFLVLLAINLLTAFFSTHSVILRRNMNFKAMASLNLLSSLAMTITAPVLAYLGAGVWSLVAEQAVGPVVRGVGLWGVLKLWQPSWRFDWREAKSSLGFGKDVFSAQVSGILLDRFDDFWIGTALGSVMLGYYSRAYEIAQYPQRILATPVTNVFYSTYTAVQENKEDLSKAFFRSSSFLIRVGFLMTAILMSTASEITVVLFGETWLPIVPVFRLMLIYIVFDPLYNNLSYLIIAVGRPNWLSQVRIIQLVLFVISVIGFAFGWGINGVAMAANLMMMTGTIILIIYSKNFVDFSIRQMFLWPSIALVTAIFISYLSVVNLQWAHVWWALVVKTSTTLVAYGVILYCAERKVIHEYGNQFLKPMWGSLRARVF